MRELSVPASFEVGDHDNIVSAVFEHERDDPDHVIYQRLIDGEWRDVTAAEAAALVRSAAQGLIAQGVVPGDRVAILSATRFEWAILDFAILSVGALTVPWYAAAGVRLVTGAQVVAVDPVRLADGRELPADVVLAAVGARPASAWPGGIAR